MPLKKGRSNKAMSSNIKEMVDSWKQNGKIGTSSPANKKKAIKQAVAIAYRKSGRSRRKTSKAPRYNVAG